MRKRHSRHINIDMKPIHEQLKQLAQKPPYFIRSILTNAGINHLSYYVALSKSSASRDMLIDLHNIGIVLDDDILQDIFPA